MNRPVRFVILFVAAALLAALLLPGADKKKKDEDELSLDPSPKKTKKDNLNQTLPAPRELPPAVIGETDRLIFQTSPLSARGLLSQQTRDAMHALLRSNHGATIIKLRAFVAGTGDMRRIQEIAGEVFGQQRQNPPALTVVQAGGLLMEGAQVVIESIAVDRRSVNPNGLAFIAGQMGTTVDESLNHIKSALEAGGMEASDLLRATCFVGALEESNRAQQAMETAFPGAVHTVMQLQRGPVSPAFECEGVARLRGTPPQGVSYDNPKALNTSPFYSQLVRVSAPKLVFTGLQLGFGSQEQDVKLAFDRLQRVLSGFNSKLDNLVMSHIYLTSMTMAGPVRDVRKAFYSSAQPPASTFLPFQALPSIDASFGVDVVAVPVHNGREPQASN